jgi:uncharacterized protein (DUF952 family)
MPGSCRVCYASDMPTLYRIVSRGAWAEALKSAAFQGSAHDQRDGYIHLSAAHQVRETAAKHYAGQPDLLLLYVREEALVNAPGTLRWELSRGGDRFPHWYGVLPAACVHRVEPLPLDAEGQHQLPRLDE